MAVWQYFLKVIPKISVIKKYGLVPPKLEINHAGWAKYQQNAWKGIRSKIDFEDAQTINWWKDISFDKERTVSAINNLIKQCGWSDTNTIGWKGDTRNNQDNDVYIHFNESGKINSFTFRTDLRDDSLDFLDEMLKICKANEWLVMDGNGLLFEPRFLEVYQSMRNSNASKFLENPEKFFEDLESGAIKPE